MYYPKIRLGERSTLHNKNRLVFFLFLNGDSFLTVLEAVSYLFAQKSVLFLEGRHCGGGKGGVGERGGGDWGGRWDPIHHCKTCNKCYWTSRSRRDHIRYKLAVIIVEKKTFNIKMKLKVHASQMHSDIMFACTICRKEFRASRTWRGKCLPVPER